MLHFLLDESVTGNVYKMLSGKPFRVDRSIDLIGQGKTDRDVVELANSMQCILIDSNCRDFKRLISRIPSNNNSRYRNAGRVSLRCKPLNESDRLSAELDLVLYESTLRQAFHDRRVIMEIAEQSVTLFR